MKGLSVVETLKLVFGFQISVEELHWAGGRLDAPGKRRIRPASVSTVARRRVPGRPPTEL